AALALGAVAAHGEARHPAALDDVLGAHTGLFTGTVTGPVRQAASTGFTGAPRWALPVTVGRVAVGSTAIDGAVPALVFVDAPPRAEIGGRVEFSGTARINPPEDTRALLVFAGEVTAVEGPPLLLSWAGSLRAGFSAASAALPGDGGGLLPGLAIGDVSRVGGELDTAMKASSLSHLTAVSGANCAVIVGAVLAICAAAGMPRRWRLLAGALALAGFVVLVTPGSSVLRAAVMAAVLLVADATGRPRQSLPALCLAVIVLLGVDPWFARDYGFALSVAATAGLLLLAGPLGALLARWTPRPLALTLAVPLAAQLACEPILVLLNPALPLYGVAANALAEPAAPFATVLGLLGCLVLPLWHPFGVALLWTAWAPAAWIGGVARTAAGLPGAAVPWFPGPLGVAAAVLVLGTVALLAAQGGGRGLRRARVAVAGATAILLVVGAATSAGPAVARALTMPRDWVVAACDVGQGDAVLVRSADEVALVDTGPDPRPLAACLGRLGIRRIDLLVLTHYDLDHVGGLDAARALTATALVDPPPGERAQASVTSLERSGAEVHVAARGDSGRLGDLSWRVLWPDPANTSLTTSNERGVVVEFVGGGVSMLFLADLDAPAQAAVLAEGGIGAVDIVKVAHHGSADQDDALYRAAGPRLGILEVGAANDYGHPTEHALTMLRGLGTAIVRTDEEGMSLVRANPDGVLSMWSEHAADPAGLWRPGRR
ncbi:ComEC/Rec2 family competence protein, partial [Gryllotalpicola sp.]|uniref:ComEC/Rec2 family competence protein n=1 Tax=Gryllotalpicola sp. TaxID=1932787 RepID=UPI002612EEAB